MAFDDPSTPPEPARRLSIVACRDGWAIKHGDGFLGVSADREEAMRLLRTLQDEPASAALRSGAPSAQSR
jgi:hypothetical protein